MMKELFDHFIIELENLESVALTLYVLVDDLYKSVVPLKVQHRRNKEEAKLSDSEIITICLLGELLGQTCENSWHSFVSKNLRNLFPALCERSRFNRTRRNLWSVIREIRSTLCLSNAAFSQELLIIDSFPLPVCEFGRAHFCKSFRHEGADYGYCASKKMFYFGYKVHALCTRSGELVDFIISPASKDDREAVWELLENNPFCQILIGDKGYLSSNLAETLLLEKGVQLIAMKRKNAKQPFPKHLRQLIFKIRRRIETSFSQLAEQFHSEQVKAKSLWGLVARMETKVLAFNCACFFNATFLHDRSSNRIKRIIF